VKEGGGGEGQRERGFANAKPLPDAPEAGKNNYLGSECDHLPEAGNIYIGIHPSAHTSAYSLWAPPKAVNVAKLIHRRRISLKRDNHQQNHSQKHIILLCYHNDIIKKLFIYYTCFYVYC
jgi:hypothetical protein